MSYEAPSWLTWVLLSIGLALAITLTYHELRRNNMKLKSQLEVKEKTRVVRKNLGDYLKEGTDLYTQYIADQDCNAWASRVGKYLEDNLGSDYVSRFHSYVGLESMKDKLEFGIYPRILMEVHLIRLQEILKEISIS